MARSRKKRIGDSATDAQIKEHRGFSLDSNLRSISIKTQKPSKFSVTGDRYAGITIWIPAEDKHANDKDMLLLSDWLKRVITSKVKNGEFMRAFSEQWGLATPEANEKLADESTEKVYQVCECGKEVVRFDQGWWEYEIDFDHGFFVPTGRHSCEFGHNGFDIPVVDHSIVDWWDTARDKEHFQRMQKAVFLSLGKGNAVRGPWVDIDLEGICKNEIDIDSSTAIDLFAKYYQWYEEGQGSFELSACEKHGCTDVGFHGEEFGKLRSAKCPFSRAVCAISFKRCDCYTVRIEGHCIEGVIDRVSKLEKPMEDNAFMSIVVGMLRFLETKI